MDQKIDQKITESHLPGQYLDITLLPWQYLDIALAAGQYKIYYPALAFDPPTQSVTYTYMYVTLSHLRLKGNTSVYIICDSPSEN